MTDGGRGRTPAASAPTSGRSAGPDEPLPLAGRPTSGAPFRLAVAGLGGAPAVLRLLAVGRATWALQLLALVAVMTSVALIPRRARPAGLVLVTAVAAFGSLRLAPEMGRAPTLVAGLGVLAAVAVADGWWSPRRWYRHGPVAVLALPFALATAAAWYRTGSIVATVAGTAAVLGVVLLCGARAADAARLDATLAAWCRRAGRATAGATRSGIDGLRRGVDRARPSGEPGGWSPAAARRLLVAVLALALAGLFLLIDR